MFTIVSHSKSAKIHVPLEMMCARGNLYKKLLFDTVVILVLLREICMYTCYTLTYAEI